MRTRCFGCLEDDTFDFMLQTISTTSSSLINESAWSRSDELFYEKDFVSSCGEISMAFPKRSFSV